MPSTRTSSRSEILRDIPGIGTFTQSPHVPSSPIRSSINLGGGISSSPQLPSRQDVRSRAVRESTRTATTQALERQAELQTRRRELRSARPKLSVPDTIPEVEDGGDAPYTSFTGTPRSTLGAPDNGADEMEAVVASLIFDSAADKVIPDTSNLTDWFDYGLKIPESAARIAHDAFICDVTPDQLASIIDRGDSNSRVQPVLVSVHEVLRADSMGAPETHADAMRRGHPWPAAINKEFSNHDVNKSWKMINRSDVPSGRRIHKFVWVFKEKRDGTAKARLCVQGCTLEEGIDYDQTFAKPLRHASARGLFAYASRNRCNIRSVDFVAAYLQGDFIDGEVVYCKQAAGSNIFGSDGQPMNDMRDSETYLRHSSGRAQVTTQNISLVREQNETSTIRRFR